MPTILRIHGYRFFFFSNEGKGKPHIHVESGDNYGKYWLKPVILVYAGPGTQIKRLMERDRCSRERAMARISSQMSIEEKKKLADIIIDNSGTIEATRAQVEVVWKKLT